MSQPSKPQPETMQGTATVYSAVALSPPPCRMFLAIVYKVEDEARHEGYAYPVVSILAPVRCDYHQSFRRGQRKPTAGVDHEAMERLGWHQDDQGPVMLPDLLVIADPYGGDSVCTMTEVIEDMAGVVGYRIVSCHWPREEDADRLRAVYEEIIRDGTGSRNPYYATFPIDPPPER